MKISRSLTDAFQGSHRSPRPCGPTGAGRWLVVLAAVLSFSAAGPAFPDLPPLQGGPGATHTTGLEAQERARQLIEEQIGRPVTDAEVLRGIQESGLSRLEVRQRLREEGYDPDLADPYFDRLERSREPGSLPGLAERREVASPRLVEGLERIGVPVGFPSPSDWRSGSPPAEPQADRAPGAETEEPDAAPPLGREDPEIFGRSLFRAATTQFEPVTTGPVDPGYRLGPGDELILVLTGDVELAYTLEVTRQGSVVIPQVGQLSVNGLTLDQLRDRLYDRLGQVYSGVRRGPEATTHFDVSLGRLRTNQVFIIGEVERPGAYQVSSVSTVFNALYHAAGPAPSGSFRRVQVRRGGELVREVDLYQYLLRGDTRDDIRLEQGDIIFVPPAGLQATLRGQLRREDGARSGADGNARIDQLVQWVLATERALADFRDAHSEDEIQASSALALELRRLERRVEIRREALFEAEGEHERAQLRELLSGGRGTVFELREGEDLADLLQFAGGFRPDAFLGRIQIDRVLPPAERTPERERILVDVPLQHLADGGAGVPVHDGDRVSVFPISDERRNRVAVRGEVFRPGDYEYVQGMTAQDLIERAQGVRTEAYAGTAHILRRNWRDGSRSLIRISLGEGGSEPAPGQVELEDLDELVVFARPQLLSPRTVRISGFVKEPGEYALAEGMTVHDLILAASGFRPGAQEFEAEVARMRMEAERTAALAETERVPLAIGIVRGDGTPAPAQGSAGGSQPRDGSEKRTEVADFQLRDGDHVFIRRLPGYEPVRTVDVRGEVLYPGGYAVTERNERVSSLLERTGGLTDEAYVPGARIMRGDLPVSVDLEAALARPGGADDITLEPNDVLVIPSYDPTVTVTGAVAFDARVRYRPGYSLQNFLDQAGGVLEDGDRRRVVVSYPDGERAVVRRRFLVRRDPPVEPGSTIHVPALDPDESTDWGQVITTSVSIVSTAATLLVALSRL